MMDASVEVAVEAFRAHERKRFAADKAEQELLIAVAQMATSAPDSDREEYHRLTEEILAEYEAKRAKARLS